MENKRPYVNYAAKQQAQAAKQTLKPEPVESVAANAPETAPAVDPVTEKVEAPVTKPIERIEEADEVTVKFVNTAILNVRSTPDATINNIVEQIKMDTKVNVIREVGEFSQIGDNKYVMTKYLI